MFLNPEFQATVTYEDIGGKTKATFRQLFETVGVFEKVKGFVPKANEENFDRLETVLAKNR